MTTSTQYETYMPTAARLVEICTTTPIRRAFTLGSDVSYGGYTWTADNGAHGEIRHTTEGERPVLELSIQNVRDSSGNAVPWSTYLASSSLARVEVKFYTVDSTFGLLDSQTNWFVAGWSLDGQYMRLRLGGPTDALAFEVPNFPLSDKTCGWARLGLYRRHPCNSESTKTTCGGTVVECMERFPSGQPIRFGPSFPFYSRAVDGRREG